VTHRVVFSPEAKADLLELYDYIARRSGEGPAIRYIERIERWCESGIRAAGDDRLSSSYRDGLRSSHSLWRAGPSEFVARSG
jgi:toxin ParE1/3/4